MNNVVIHAEDIWKEYNLGVIGYGSLRADMQSWWAKKNGKEDPNSKLDQFVNERSYKHSFWALQNISFEVRQGEVMGIIGRNGAGKSTLLKILSRLTLPTRGQLKIKGKVASLLEVGTGFHPELTGRENVYLNGAILGMTKDEIKRKFDEIVGFAGIEKFVDTPVKRYSSGMYVRLAFAVGAHLDSEILIVDEVLAVGDLQFQKKCIKKIQDIQSDGRTILFVSHSTEMIKKLCNRCIWLEKGNVKSVGISDIVAAEYVSMTQTTADGDSSEAQSQISTVIDLSKYISRHGNNEIKIQSVELVNATNNKFCSLWNEPIQLKMKVKINQRIKNVSFGIGISTMDDISILTVRNTDNENKLLDFAENDECEVLVNVIHNLRAGKYILHLGITSDENVCYYNSNAAYIEISTEGTSNYRLNNTGLINCNSKWEVIM